MKKKKRSIYLDYAASTPVDHRAFFKMRRFLSSDFGNPGSIHNSGLVAMRALDTARKETAMVLGAKHSEIVFTSGGTESDNMAILGVANFFKRVGRGKRLHLITTKTEHHAVLKPFKFLELNGFDITYLPVSKRGVVDPQKVKEALKDNTVLVSIMYANNETGSIQPIREIGNVIRKKRGDLAYPVFHTDACQAPGYLSLQVSNLGVDLMTLCGSKTYGPKGSGILYVKSGTPIDPIMFGGEQEGGLRSGTQNVPACVGFGEAIKIADGMRKKESERISRLRNIFWEKLKLEINDIELNGDLNLRLPNNLNVFFPGISGEQIVVEMDMNGVMVSSGSACSSREEAPSHVLVAMYGSKDRAESSVRFTLGRGTIRQDIDKTVKILKEIVVRLRKSH